MSEFCCDDSTIPPPRHDGLDLLRGLAAGREQLARSLAVPRYRVDQIVSWVLGRGVVDLASMTDLPAALRRGLAERLGPIGPTVAECHEAGDSTKYLVGLHDGESVECVAMAHPWGLAACLSSQVGCAVGCVFCASGAAGVVRNLEAAEITGQFLAVRLRHGTVGHAVLMGMGEPLLNPSGTLDALRQLTDPALFALPERNVTVSTVGVVRGIARLAESGLRVRLAVSVHAGDPELRAELVPHQPDPLADVLAAARAYEQHTRRRVTYECVLVSGVNDSDGCARTLARALGAGAHVNLIALNAVPGCTWAAPGEGSLRRFEKVLAGCGLKVSIRRSRGATAEAACGQLRLRARHRQGDWTT
jgi:23S rRNA (adenine2503-C2)-methyltransferase